jgi:hypothetical protein
LEEIQISSLAHCDVVFAGKKQELFRSFQLAQITDVLAVDPDAGGVFDFGRAKEFYFAQDLILSVQGGDQEKEDRKDEQWENNAISKP